MKEFATKEELFKHLKANKQLLVMQKKSAMKHGDNATGTLKELPKTEFEQKDMGTMADGMPIGKIRVKAIINTSNILDSHGDVHIGNIWKKSISELKYVVHLESHEREFDAVIAASPDVTAYVKSLTWKSLGYDYEGSTQALIFDSVVSAERNEFMFNQYKSGYVQNHSVGMQYVTLYLCINSDDRWYAEEKDNWDKYYPMVANKEEADMKGYFWAVTEAKLIEGSAVVLGSCPVTPTQSVEDITDDEEGAGNTSTSSKQKPANNAAADFTQTINQFNFKF